MNLRHAVHLYAISRFFSPLGDSYSNINKECCILLVHILIWHLYSIFYFTSCHVYSYCFPIPPFANSVFLDRIFFIKSILKCFDVRIINFPQFCNDYFIAFCGLFYCLCFHLESYHQNCKCRCKCRVSYIIVKI